MDESSDKSPNAGENPDKKIEGQGAENGAESKPVASNLPVVWSPKLDAGAGMEDEALDADAAAEPPSDEAPPDETAQEEASETAAAAPPRSWRFALLAATIALAAGLGSFVGSLTASGVGQPAPEITSSLNTADASAVLRALKSQVAELTAMKSNLDGAIRSANTQYTAIADRLDRVERAEAAANPSAQLAHIADAVDRLNKINATPETTGSIAPTMAPVPADSKLADRIVQDWIVQDVHGDRALVESRNGGLFEVGPGSFLPGIGRVETVKRQDGQWVVVTARGVITSGR
jgi:hypothetical protein